MLKRKPEIRWEGAVQPMTEFETICMKNFSKHSAGLSKVSPVQRDLEGQAVLAPEDVEWAQRCMGQIVDNISLAVIGKRKKITAVLTAFCARGHVLLEDHPGVGKTLMARSFAKTTGMDVGRVQYTPDVVPSDVTGSVIFSRQDEEFKFRPGPVFTNILLADEINRGTPRTQSSLLEAMEELAVTVDGTRHVLPRPFFVLATQNPLEVHGTFPLPESQLDRFMMKLSLGYPDVASEDLMLRTYCAYDPLVELEPVTTPDELRRLMKLTASVYLGEKTRAYLLAIVSDIREDPRVKMGVSPRGTLSLARAGQAHALTDGRDSVLPDDIQDLAVTVLAHRVVPHSHADNAADIVNECLNRVPVPA